MDRRATLEAAIDANPDDVANYLVLADVLQELGDPRGAAIIANVALDKTLGPPAPRFGANQWFHGYVRAFRTSVDTDVPDAVAAHLEHPSLRFVQRIEYLVPGSVYDERQWLIDTIAAHPRPAVRHLTINSFIRGGNEPPGGDLELAPLWDKLPRLVSLAVTARWIRLASLASPTLETLVLDGETEARELRALLGGACPKLRELVLMDVDDGFADEVARSPLAAQLARCEIAPRDAGDRYEQTGE